MSSPTEAPPELRVGFDVCDVCRAFPRRVAVYPVPPPPRAPAGTLPGELRICGACLARGLSTLAVAEEPRSA